MAALLIVCSRSEVKEDARKMMTGDHLHHNTEIQASR